MRIIAFFALPHYQVDLYAWINSKRSSRKPFLRANSVLSGTEFYDLVGRQVLAIERVFIQYNIQFFAAHAFRQNNATDSRYLSARGKKMTRRIVLIEELAVLLKIFVHFRKGLNVVQ